MHFAQPYILYVLLFLPLMAGALILLARYRNRRIASFAIQSLSGLLSPDFSSGLYVFKNILIMGVFLFSILALARPQWGFEWQEVKHQGLDIFMVVDTSKSMLAEDIKPNRLERARMAIRDFLNKLKGDRIGLVAFAGDAFLTCPLTADYSGFALSLNDLSVNSIPRGGTNIGRAIQEVLRGYEDVPSQYKVGIIITDGENWEGDALAWAKTAAEKKIRLYTIGIGTLEGELVRLTNEQGGSDFLKDKDGNVVKSRLNEAVLANIAAVTGGGYARASGAEFGLDYLYDNELSHLEKRDIESKVERKFHERFQWVLCLAFLSLFLETLLPLRRLSLLNGKAALALLFVFLMFVPEVLAATGATQVNRGNAYFRQEKYDQALTNYEEASRINPSEPLIDYALAAGYYKTGDFARAKEHYQKSLLVDDPLIKPDVHYNLGNALYQQGLQKENKDLDGAIKDLESAMASYDAALVLKSSDADARYNKEVTARTLERLKQKKKQQNENQRQQQNSDSSQGESKQDSPSDGEQNDDQKAAPADGFEKNNQDPYQDQEQSQDNKAIDKQEKDKNSSDAADQQHAEDQGNKNTVPAGQSPGDQLLSQEEAARLLEDFGRNEEPKTLLNFNRQTRSDRAAEKEW